MSHRLRFAGVARATVATLVLVVALITVGLTAPLDGPFSIGVQPVFLRLGLDLDVKIGSVHLHASWSALPDGAATTTEKTEATETEGTEVTERTANQHGETKEQR